MMAWVRYGFVRVFPYAHAGMQALSFIFMLTYLFEKTNFYSPFLWLFSQKLLRITREDIVKRKFFFVFLSRATRGGRGNTIKFLTAREKNFQLWEFLSPFVSSSWCNPELKLPLPNKHTTTHSNYCLLVKENWKFYKKCFKKKTHTHSSTNTVKT